MVSSEKHAAQRHEKLRKNCALNYKSAELTPVLVRLAHVARFIVNANHSIM
jgi:hypothetical protein